MAFALAVCDGRGVDDDRFHLFFNQVDSFRERHFLYLSSKGIEATKPPPGEEAAAAKADGEQKQWAGAKLAAESDDDEGAADEEG